MKVAVIAAALSLAAFSANADDRLVRFDGGIGVIPVSSGQGTAATATVVNRNIVRGVQPPGQLWVISSLKADVRTTARSASTAAACSSRAATPSAPTRIRAFAPR
jgi:hypothetical protein